MADKKKDDKNTVEERVEEALSDALAKEMGEIPDVSITVKELKEMEKASRKKKRRKLTKFVSVAAVAVVVCAAVVYLAWPESIVPVDADKNTEQRVQEGDGEIIINEGDVEGDSGVVEITETDWNNIQKHKALVPQLGTPEYIPQGFNFKKIVIEKYKDGGFFAQYFYTNKKAELCVEQMHYSGASVKSSYLDKKVEKINTPKGNVYIVEGDGTNKVALRYIDDEELRVSAPLGKAELVDIIGNIKLP